MPIARMNECDNYNSTRAVSDKRPLYTREIMEFSLKFYELHKV